MKKFVDCLDMFTTGMIRFGKYMQMHPKGTLVFLMLGSLLLKFLVYCDNPLLCRDAALYCLMAQKWHEVGDYSHMIKTFSYVKWIPPVFLWCLKTMISWGWPVEIAGVVFNMFCGILLIPVGYGIALEVSQNKKIALITAAFLAVHPRINDLSVDVLRDILFLLLMGMTIWAALAGIRRKRWDLWCIGAALAGMNFLVRYESLESIPIVGIVLGILCLKGIFPWKKALVFLVLWFVCFSFSFAFGAWGIGQTDVISVYKQRISVHISILKKPLLKTERMRK